MPYQKNATVVLKQQNADYEKYGFLQEIYARTGKKSFLSFVLWQQINNRNIPPIMSFSGTHRDEKQTDEQTKISCSFNKNINKIKLKIMSGYAFDKLNYFLADSNSYTHSIINNVQFDYRFNKNTLFSVKFHNNFYLSNTYDSAYYTVTKYKAERLETGVKISVHKKITKRFSAFLLTYLNYADKNFQPFIPSIGADFKLLKNKEFYLKTNFSRNYHLPTLNDLYWLPGGNPNLRPEIGYSADFGIDYYEKYENIQFKTSIDAYASLIDDWIIWRPSEYRYWTAQNIKKVFARGVEFSCNIKGNIKKFNYQIITNYTFTKTTNLTSTTNNDLSIGKQLIYIPLNTFNLHINLNYKKFYIDNSFLYTGRRYTTSSNQENRHILPAYFLNNFAIGKQFNFKKFNFALRFKIENIFNQQYQAVLYRAMSGRNFKFLLMFEF